MSRSGRILPFDWRRVVVYTHRWLGIAGCVLFVTWFISGIVMMYARMPGLTDEERLLRMAALDLSSARVDPAEAARRLARPPDQVRVGMLDGRPIYRFRAGRESPTVFADNAESLGGLTVDQVMRVARRFAPESAPRYDTLLNDSDQWTLGGDVRARMPVHRVALSDAAGTVVYISDRTGEVVMKTTRSARRWAYVGAVPHWLYFTPFRRHRDLWAWSIIWLSIAGAVLSVLGVAWGLWRYSRSRRYRLKGIRSHSPYAGLMRWHHYAGLIFGATTFTWIFSGLLSMDPWSWSPATSPTAEQREAVMGGRLRLDLVTANRLRAGVSAITSSFVATELEVVQFQGEPFLIASSGRDHRLVSAVAPARPFTRFDESALIAAARLAMPETAVAETVWLREYDAYYYDRDGRRPLPVLRVRYADPAATTLYLDPRRGMIVRKEERLSRVNRWLYHGLHSLDFPFLYYRRPLWDAVVIGLSLGGIVVSASTVPKAWRRLRGHARRRLVRRRPQFEPRTQNQNPAPRT